MNQLINDLKWEFPAAGYYEKGGIPYLTGEFWDNKQRSGHSIHEIPYRGCFKPELPAFFIEGFSAAGDTVFDPFSGRGTTAIQAALMDRRALCYDANPVGFATVFPRLFLPTPFGVMNLLHSFGKVFSLLLERTSFEPIEGFGFEHVFHQHTLEEMWVFRNFLHDVCAHHHWQGPTYHAAMWLNMVMLSRLTGHSEGYLSVHTMPPNVAVTPERQAELNIKHGRKPEYRALIPRLVAKTRSLIKDFTAEQVKTLRARMCGGPLQHQVWEGDWHDELEADSIDLIVTSPPFCDLVDYTGESALKYYFDCSFNLNHWRVPQTALYHKPEDWGNWLKTKIFPSMARVLKPNGLIVFEVGTAGKVNLDEVVCRVAGEGGLHVLGVMIHEVEFTKTSHIMNIDNNKLGVNTNRIVLMERA